MKKDYKGICIDNLLKINWSLFFIIKGNSNIQKTDQISYPKKQYENGTGKRLDESASSNEICNNNKIKSSNIFYLESSNYL